MNAWEAISVTAASDKTKRLTTGGLIAGLSWLLFVISVFSPLSNLAVQVAIGAMLAYYYLLFGLKPAALLYLVISILTFLRPGVPLNLALVAYFLPWPLLKGWIEGRIYKRGIEQDAPPRWFMRHFTFECRLVKWAIATGLFVLALLGLTYLFPGFKETIVRNILNFVGEHLPVAKRKPILIGGLYCAFLIFTWLYDQFISGVSRLFTHHSKPHASA